METKATPPYGSPHIGWWPDPILDFMKEADVAKGDAQAFWIRVRAPKSQVPDLYHGKLEVLVEGRPRFAFDFAVRVYGFTMPDAPPLPLAITFAPHDHPTDQTKEVQAKWREMEEYPVNAWRRYRSRWADFLADYYITYDSLYEHRDGSPTSRTWRACIAGPARAVQPRLFPRLYGGWLARRDQADPGAL